MFFRPEDRVASPFPWAQRSELLPRTEFEALAAEFPDETYFHSRHLAHQSLRRGTPEFDAFLASSPAWTAFFERLNDRAFVDHCLGLFAGDLEPKGAKVDPDRYRFSPRGVSPWRQYVRSLENAYYYVQRGIEKSAPRRWLNELLGRDELYLQATLATATPGYGKQIHRDRPHQVVILLIYFDDLIDCGGELILYRPRNGVAPNGIDRRDVPEEMVEPVQTLPCRANSGVLMLNSADAYHAVSPMVEGAPPRRFLGLAISKRYTRDAWRPA